MAWEYLSSIKAAVACPSFANNRITEHIARSQQETDVRLFEGMKEGTSSKHLLKSDDSKDKELLKMVTDLFIQIAVRQGH
ncbi:hypothetical protein [Desulfotomaculum sp. 1211_IL3151]|uniref:hypothetical protein n=1 Tax=Desulfotomaculum sp. 1211_IL3151 TaxID=3084055 RepID=UPI002FD8DBEE